MQANSDNDRGDKRMTSLGDYFVSSVPGFVVGDVWCSRPPKDISEVQAISVRIVTELLKKLPTEQDLYWFVVEEYDRILQRGNVLPTLVEHYPLCEIEHDGRRSATSYVGKPNPGVVFLDEKVSPILTATFGEATSNQIRCGIYGAFRELDAERVRQLRVKYAVHYHNNCITNGHFRHAEMWGEVIELLDG